MHQVSSSFERSNLCLLSRQWEWVLLKSLLPTPTNVFIILGVFDNTLDRSDRKISAHATLETPPHRTAFPTGTDFKLYTSSFNFTMSELRILGVVLNFRVL